MCVNYQKKLNTLLCSLKGRPRLLLHSCCAPCSSYVLEYLNAYFDLTLYYYNPCIYHEEEYRKRKLEQLRFVRRVYADSVAILDADYRHADFLAVCEDLSREPEGGARCRECIGQRIFSTAEAAASGYEWFCSTLSVGPKKSAVYINDAGEAAQQKFGSKWLYSDFKKNDGYARSVQLSARHRLYRQNYCGCEYSIKNNGDL